MSIQDWSSIAEIVGAIAVVVSLLYLAIQMRSQNREARLSTINSSLAEWNSLLALVADSSELASIWNRGLKNEELSEDEEVRFRAFANSYLRVVEGLYLQHLEGRLDDRIWHGISKGTTDMLAATGLHRFWSHRQDWYSSEFREFVDTAMKSSKVTNDSLYQHDTKQEPPVRPYGAGCQNRCAVSPPLR
jgi:hypothetical protein